MQWISLLLRAEMSGCGGTKCSFRGAILSIDRLLALFLHSQICMQASLRSRHDVVTVFVCITSTSQQASDCLVSITKYDSSFSKDIQTVG